MQRYNFEVLMPGNKKPNRKGKKKQQTQRARSALGNLNQHKSEAEVGQALLKLQQFGNSFNELRVLLLGALDALQNMVDILEPEDMVSKEAPAIEQQFNQYLELIESKQQWMLALEEDVARWVHEVRQDKGLLQVVRQVPKMREQFVALSQESQLRREVFENVYRAMRLLAQYLAHLHAKAQQILAQQGPFGSAAEHDAALQAATKEAAFQMQNGDEAQMLSLQLNKLTFGFI